MESNRETMEANGYHYSSKARRWVKVKPEYLKQREKWIGKYMAASEAYRYQMWLYGEFRLAMTEEAYWASFIGRGPFVVKPPSSLKLWMPDPADFEMEAIAA
jgi:hypothetical protein